FQMSGGLKFYGVAHGFHRGVYEDWTQVQKEIDTFPQAVYKKFESREEAEKYVEAAKPARVEFANCEEEAEKWYAVARGKVVGVFTKYDEVQRHTDGYPQPLFKKFESYGEAKAFVDKFYEGKSDGEGEKKEEKLEKLEKAVEMKEEKAVEKNSEEEEVMEKKETNGTTSAAPAPKPKKEKKEKKEREPVVVDESPRETRSSRRGEKPVTYYAVARGHKTGVFTDWNECKAATGGFKGARFKKFDLEADAKMFAAGKSMKEIEGSKRKASESDSASPPPKKGKKASKA
ncbi:hypothetical protein PMAYCL1PPCAC_06005, partial [Pristionchus mayeri]